MASVASAKDNNPAMTGATSISGLCLAAALKHGKPDALNQKVGDEWIHIPAATFVERVQNVALGLAALGIRPGDRIALLSENRPEWSIVDLAILSLGAINVPIYTTQAVDQIDFILKDSGARAIFISNRKLYRHARTVLAERMLEHLIFFDPEVAEDIDRGISLEALENRGKTQAQERPEAFDAYLGAVRPDDLATIIYTSGTTGEPKGVMLTHNNFMSNVLAITKGLPIGPTDVALSVLPLSHIFERAGFYVFCYNGVSVYYAGSFDQVGENLREVGPTVMTAVPRLFEKVYHRIVKKGMAEKGWKRRIFTRSLAVGQRYGELKDTRRRVPARLRLKHGLASRMVFSKWREGVGGRLRYFVSGGAPLSPALSYSYLAAGIPILQGYGATETCIVTVFKLSNGKYVAPQIIESLLKQSEFVNQVTVVGAGRKQPAALIVPDWENLKQALSESEKEFPQDRVELSRHSAAIRIVQRDVAALTSELSDYERIRRIALLPDEFSIAGGELTPTLKIKRSVIDQRFGDLIEELYS